MAKFWVPVVLRTNTALAWLRADTEEMAWSKLRRSLSACLPCTDEMARERGYGVVEMEVDYGE